MRFIVQRALSNEFLHWDLPIDVTGLRWDLSGPGVLRGTISPDVGRLRADDDRRVLEPWGSLVYAEEQGRIKWGGIVQRSTFSGPDWEIEAAGFTSYPSGIPWLGNFKSKDADPADVFRMIWEELQSYPDADLGVTVDDTKTKSRLGSDEEPYTLQWWETKDSGDELASLAEDGRFDFEEVHEWDGDDIRHHIRIGYPRLGRKRDDLVFVQGDNVTSLVEPKENEEFANEVFALGAGEGRKARRTRTPIRDGRLRRPIVYTDKGERNRDRLRRLARMELDIHRPRLGIETIEVIDHPNAQIGSWALGDDILVQADLPWVGEVALWHRIEAWEWTGSGTATLDLAPSDSFIYASGA